MPAKSVDMRPFKAIFTRILSIDSVSEGMSSFFIDSAQVASFLVSEKNPVLVILDEYGKGTSPIGGVALLAAVLRNVLKNNDKSQIVLCATHQPEIFDAGIMPNDTNLGTLSMEMVRVDSESNTTNTNSTSKVQKLNSDSSPSSEATNSFGMKEQSADYVRTYRLIPGTICTESRAVQCALEFGIRRNELRRAMNIKVNASAAPRTGMEDNETGMNEVVLPLFHTGMKGLWMGTKVFTRKNNSTRNTTHGS